MAQAIIQQQPVDGDFDYAVDSESDISGDDSGMETDEDDNVHVGGNGNGPWVCVPIDEHYEMPYQPGNFVQDPAPMNRPNINATPVDYFDYFTTDQESNLNLIDKLVTETNRYAEQSIQQPISAHSRMNNWVPTDCSEMRAFIGVMMAMGLLKKPTIKSYWNKGDSFQLQSPSFSQVFSRNKFQNILRHLHCNDNTQAAPRGSPEYDPGYTIRPVFDILNNTFDRKYHL